MSDRICPECDTRGDGDVCPRCGTRMLYDVPSEPGFDPLVGKVFDGRYRLEDQLGKGGMGVVYRAVQIAMGKVVAVKVLRGELVAHREAARRFHREAKAASLLSHPHTVRVFDFGQTRDRELFMVMEYLEGRTLGEVLAEHGRLPADRAAGIVAEVAEALMEAHSKGLVHRDLKPDNVILLDLPGHPDFVKVLDFGIAKLLTENGEGSDVTRTGAVVGTPTYMAPEQMQGASALSPALDVYALGVVLFEALVGAPPFRGNTPLEVVLAHVNQPVPEIPDDIEAPAPIRALLRAMLAKAPAARPSATEVFEVLRGHRLLDLARRLTNEPADAAAIAAGGAPTVLLDHAELTLPRRRRWPWLAVGVGSLLLAGVLLLVSQASPPRSPPSRAKPSVARVVADPAPVPGGDVAEPPTPAPAVSAADDRDVVTPADVDSRDATPVSATLDAGPEKRETIDAASRGERGSGAPVRARSVPRTPRPAERADEPAKPKYEPVW